jgi:hypothetical protein
VKNPVVIAELRRLAAEHGGILKAETVVEAASDDESPLHDHFEWDDSAAALAHRLHQARMLINRVVVQFETPTGPREHNVFVSVTTDRVADGGGYRVLSDAMSDDELRTQLLQDALAEMKAFQAKYSRLTELSDVFSAMAHAEAAQKPRRGKKAA